MDRDRQPRDLRGLLKFCTDMTKNEDAPHSSEFSEMDEDRRAWLHEALTSMTEDPVKRLQAALEIIASAEADGTDQMEESFEVLAEYCEDIDLAKDFVKIGGFPLLLGLLERPAPSTRANAANVIAVCCQNNPFCQETALEIKLLPVLLKIIDEDPSAQAKTKALYAVSCLCRSSEAGQQALLSADGFSVLLRAMQGQHQRVQIKAAFMIGALSTENPAVQKALTDIGMVTQLVSFLSADSRDFREQVLFAVCSLCRGSEAAQRQLREAQLDEWLAQHVVASRSKDECEDEVRYCEQLQEYTRVVEEPAR